MKRHTNSFRRRWLRGISHSFTLALITGVATIAPFAASQVATAATETKLGPTNIEIVYAQGFGNSGDLPMPDCGSFNIEGRRGHAEWNISSSLGDNSAWRNVNSGRRAAYQKTNPRREFSRRGIRGTTVKIAGSWQPCEHLGAHGRCVPWVGFDRIRFKRAD